MAMLDIPHFAPPKFDPEKDDFRCFIFRFKEYCALYKLNVGMPRRHLLIQALPDEAIRRILDHYGSRTVHDQHQVNWCTFDEMIHILEKMYCKPKKVEADDSDADADDEEDDGDDDESHVAEAVAALNELDIASCSNTDTQNCCDDRLDSWKLLPANSILGHVKPSLSQVENSKKQRMQERILHARLAKMKKKQEAEERRKSIQLVRLKKIAIANEAKQKKAEMRASRRLSSTKTDRTTMSWELDEYKPDPIDFDATGYVMHADEHSATTGSPDVDVPSSSSVATRDGISEQRLDNVATPELLDFKQEVMNVTETLEQQESEVSSHSYDGHPFNSCHEQWNTVLTHPDMTVDLAGWLHLQVCTTISSVSELFKPHVKPHIFEQIN